MDKNKLIEDNMNLVYYLISRYYPTFIKDEDLIQCGMVGLCKAANSSNAIKYKFSTYASACILNEIKSEFIRRKKYAKEESLNALMEKESIYGMEEM